MCYLYVTHMLHICYRVLIEAFRVDRVTLYWTGKAVKLM